MSDVCFKHDRQDIQRTAQQGRSDAKRRGTTRAVVFNVLSQFGQRQHHQHTEGIGIIQEYSTALNARSGVLD